MNVQAKAALHAISPIDGRYAGKTRALSAYFSEYALIKYRVLVEVKYLIFLAEVGLPQLPAFSAQEQEALHSIYQEFNEGDALAVKEIEATTNHDVKAVEYFLREKLEGLGLERAIEFIHFGLTSQDINNTAIPLMMKDACEGVFEGEILNVINKLAGLMEACGAQPMLARTHGQAASPSLLSKEIEVFKVRIEHQLQMLKDIPFAAKFGGATGNFNAHAVAYPDKDWHGLAKTFVEDVLGLKRSMPTTQIEHYDYLAAWCHAAMRINTILIDFSRDVWQYISMGYFGQRTKAGEVGSSAMPHKVNPIDFENAEGNLGLANAIFEHLASKLPVSRLQRDLTDSTVLRNVGVPIAHSLLAYQSLLKGMDKLTVNHAVINADLQANWAVVAEAIQTILRREQYPHPYEALKALTRGTEVNEETIKVFVAGLNVREEVKQELLAITPFNYVGVYK